MKKQNLLFLVGTTLIFVSCKKEEEPVITEEQSTEVVESTLSTNEAGVTTDYSKMAEIAVEEYDTYQYNCSYTGDTSYALSQSTGIRTYDMDVNLSWTVDCNGGTVNAITFDYSRNGSYSGPKLTRSGSETGALTFTNLASAETNLIANGNLVANGNLDFTVQGDEKTASTVTSLTVTDLVINKSNYQIQGGTGSLTIDATAEDNSTTFTGSLTFNGNGEVVVVINGTSYTIDLYP